LSIYINEFQQLNRKPRHTMIFFYRAHAKAAEVQSAARLYQKI